METRNRSDRRPFRGGGHRLGNDRQRSQTRWRWLLSIVTVIVTGSGLCVTTTGVAGAAQATGTPITFGVVATLTGPEGEPEGTQGLTAYVNNWNAHGGYKGHPIEIIAKDAQLSGQLYTSEARQLVQQGVIGMIAQDGSGGDCLANNPYYISQQIGVLGGGCKVGTLGSFDPRYDFPLANVTTGTAGLAIVAKYAIEHGKKKIGILLPPLPFQQLEASLAKYAKTLGGQVVLPATTLPLTPTGADIDAALATLKSEGVDAVINLVQGSTGQLILQQAALQDFGPANGIYYLFGPTLDAPQFAAGVPDAYALSYIYPWTTNTPAYKAALKLVKGHVTSLDAFTGVGFDDGAVLQAVLNNVKGPVTRASFITAMAHTKSVSQPLVPIKIDLANPTKTLDGGVVVRSVNGAWQASSPFLTAPY